MNEAITRASDGSSLLMRPPKGAESFGILKAIALLLSARPNYERKDSGSVRRSRATEQWNRAGGAGGGHPRLLAKCLPSVRISSEWAANWLLGLFLEVLPILVGAKTRPPSRPLGIWAHSESFLRDHMKHKTGATSTISEYNPNMAHGP